MGIELVIRWLHPDEINIVLREKALERISKKHSINFEKKNVKVI
jgi:hypothetical protein